MSEKNDLDARTKDARAALAETANIAETLNKNPRFRANAGAVAGLTRQLAESVGHGPPRGP